MQKLKWLKKRYFTDFGLMILHVNLFNVGIWYVLTCKQHGRGFQNLQILLKIAKKLQIGKDYDKKEYEYQKYIYWKKDISQILD
jgi:hypothetical protein